MGEAEAMALALQLSATWLLTGHRSASLCDGFRHRSELAEALDLLTTRQPLLLVLEDLHWSDYSALDLLAVLARRRESSRLLLLGTYRLPDALQRGHPLTYVHRTAWAAWGGQN
jgi:ActR/RegA family two-component response regulator